MTSLHDEPPAAASKSIISGSLNSALLTQFLFGGYFGLWVFTLVIYCNSRHGRRPISAILTSLFVLTSVQVVIQWYSTYVTFARDLVHRTRIFSDPNSVNRVFTMGQVDHLLIQVSQALADGLLVWRSCHLLSGTGRRNLRTMVICLFITEIGSISISIVLVALDFSYARVRVGTIDFDRLYNIWLGFTFLLTAVTSIIASFVIGAQIFYSTADNTLARRRYTHITDIIMQSSALYSFSILCQAIEALINRGIYSHVGIGMINAEMYTGTMATFITSFAPTLMVARLTMKSNTGIKYFSTNTIASGWEPDTLSTFTAHRIEDEDSNTEINDDSLDENHSLGRSKTGKV